VSIVLFILKGELMPRIEYTVRDLIFEGITAILKLHNQHHMFKKCDCENILQQFNEMSELFDFRVAQEVFRK